MVTQGAALLTASEERAPGAVPTQTSSGRLGGAGREATVIKERGPAAVGTEQAPSGSQSRVTWVWGGRGQETLGGSAWTWTSFMFGEKNATGVS